MSAITISDYVKNGGLGGGVGGDDQTGTSVTLNRYVQKHTVRAAHISSLRHTVYLLLFVTGAALLLSTVYLILTRIFTKAIMHITLILSIALNM